MTLKTKSKMNWFVNVSTAFQIILAKFGPVFDEFIHVLVSML